MEQQWCCEACGARGTVTIPRGASVFAGIESIAKVHTNKSVTCATAYGVKRIRVRNPGLCDAKEWSELIHRVNAKRASTTQT